VIPDPDLRDILADRFHDAGSFVTEHNWQWIGERTLDHFEIGMTQTAGFDFDEHIGRGQRGHVQHVDGHRLVDLVQHCGTKLHESSGRAARSPRTSESRYFG